MESIINWFTSLNVDMWFIIFVSLFLFVGFIKGVGKGGWKSFFYLISTIALIIVSYIFAPSITDYVKNINIGWMKIVIEGQPLNTIMDLPIIIESSMPEIAQYLQNYDLSLTLEVITLTFVKFLVFILLVIVIWLFGWIIQGILYNGLFQFFIPKSAKKKNHGFLGGIFGLIRAFIFLILLTLPLSMINDYAKSASYTPQNNTEEFIINLSDVYTKSFIGQFMNFKFGSTSINDLILENVTSMEINGEVTNLNEELNVLAKTYRINETHKLISFNNDKVVFNLDNLNALVIEEIYTATKGSVLLKDIVSELLISLAK